jgi:hypothetical protein
MKVFICVLFLSGLAYSKFLKPSEILIDIGENREKIVKIFGKVSTLNVLLKNYEQPEGIVKLLESIFPFGHQSFVVFNFAEEESYTEWLEHCKAFQNDSSIRTMYYERLYQKTHEPQKQKRNLNFFEDFEPDMGLLDEDSIDPQSPIASSPVRLQESFAEGLDRWFTFRHSGFILFSTFDALNVYLGCLLNRAGTFLIIVERDSYNVDSHLENVAELLKKAWKVSANLKLFVLISREVYILNPFMIDENSKSFGMLEKLPDSEVNRGCKGLNGYPMNVEIFTSAYSVPSEGNFTGKLDSFRGPDVEVARFIQQQMNTSSN